MLHIRIIAVGRLRENYLAAACAEYAKRLLAFCRLQITEIEEARLPDNPSPAQIAQALEREGARILEAAGKRGALVALCVEGESLSSPALAKRLEALAAGGTSAVSFVIGGSCGLSDLVKDAAALRLSMSAMTFPHQLARVMLLEQLYRSFTLTAGGKYHK